MEKKNYLYSFPEVWKAIWQLRGSTSQPSDNAFKLTGDNLTEEWKALLYNKIIESPIYYELWKDGFEVYMSGGTYGLSNSLINIRSNGSDSEVSLNNTQYTDEELLNELAHIFVFQQGGGGAMKKSNN